ncbi:MAG: hypothetical protein MUE53_02770 [Chitinophagales bacterium]|jgi:predicted RNase H-like nuclease (RuvC/YqgF family)|nr:hypothetical protein [Chitinophagales bacterium]
MFSEKRLAHIVEKIYRLKKDNNAYQSQITQLQKENEYLKTKMDKAYLEFKEKNQKNLEKSVILADNKEFLINKLNKYIKEIDECINLIEK